VSSLRDTASTLSALRGGVDTLQQAMGRVRAEVAEPHRHIAASTQQLAHLTSAVELLHGVTRALKLVAKLRESLAAGDLARAAKTLSDVAVLRSEVDLTGVTVLDKELLYCQRASAEVRAEAGTALQRGLDGLSQADVAAALQVLANLGELCPAVERAVQTYARRAGAALLEALDAGKRGAAAGTGAAGGDALLPRLEASMDRIHAAALAMWHLQRVLAKKRDPVTQAVFLDEVLAAGQQASPCDRFWAAVVHTLRDQFNRAHQLGGQVREQLTGGYPRLLTLLDGLAERLLRETDPKDKGVPPAIRREVVASLRASAQALGSLFLARSLQRVTDAVPSVPTPTTADVARLTQRVHDELAATVAQPELCAAVAAGASKALRLLAERCEHACAAGPDARLCTGPCSPAQARTLTAVAALEAAHAGIAVLLPVLPAGASESLAPGLGALLAAATDGLHPLFRGMGDTCETLLAGMHAQRWGGDRAGSGPSPYCEDLCRALNHFATEFLARLPHTPHQGGGGRQHQAPSGGAASGAMAAQLVSRLLLLFVHHASLLRPMDEGGKLRLATDLAELELAAAAVTPLEVLGPAYKALRGMKPLLFLDPRAVGAAPPADVPRPVVLHLLLSQAPEAVGSPHARAGLSAAKYVAWMDKATDEDVTRGVRAAVDAALAAGGCRADDPVVEALLQLTS
jgi:hypothetical protein